MSDKNPIVPPVIITITLPAEDAELSTMLIQRGELAHMRRFMYDPVVLGDVVKQAYMSLVGVEAAPPVIPAPPPPAPAPRPASTPAPAKPSKPKEKTFKITIGKRDFIDVPESYLRPVAEHARLIPVATKLVNGKLWDGKYPIQINDIDAVITKMRYMTEKDLSLFSLEDFAQRVTDEPTPAADPEPEPVIDEAEDVNTDDDTEDMDESASDQ